MQQVPEAEPAPPLLIVLSGPSGVGKDAALNALKLLDRPWHFVVTATTRPQRPGEQDGIDYIFLETAAFLEMKEQDELLECAQVYGNWYGVPRSQVSQGLKEGKDVILKVDVQGADTVRKLATEALFIFMVPGSFDELRDRLTQRMTERPSEIDLRLSIAWSELGRVAEYDYRVVNRDDQLEQVIAEIDAIITAEKCRVHPRKVDSL
ncbi:MAG: guanylate kinase [Chloroflexi bacterium]|nr:guanylate kinase [Chloroflexota bacterium]HAI08540.1 guanylate kinase [Dehalococcoidia bacterium]HAJ00432.1 guanylate kinase [Dehalococcoidia bacterium]